MNTDLGQDFKIVNVGYSTYCRFNGCWYYRSHWSTWVAISWEPNLFLHRNWIPLPEEDKLQIIEGKLLGLI